MSNFSPNFVKPKNEKGITISVSKKKKSNGRSISNFEPKRKKSRSKLMHNFLSSIRRKIPLTNIFRRISKMVKH